MRVAVWNLGWNRSADQIREMWSILQHEVGADVALVQEAVPEAGTNAVWRAIDGRRWGSAVFGFTTELSELPVAKGRANSKPQRLIQTWPGSVAIATATFGNRRLTFVSIYGVIDGGYADATVNRQLSDLTPLFDSAALGEGIVIGGDLNITTQWTGSDTRYGTWEAATFDRIRGFGLADCLDVFRKPGPLSGCDCRYGANCRHIQTQRHSRSSRPWQNDYLFASQGLMKSHILKNAYVHDSEAIHELGDHMPLVADFDL